MKRRHVAGVPPKSLPPPDPAAVLVAGVPPPTEPPKTLLKKAWRLIKIVFAFTLILIAGALGLVPGIPGWPLALVGLSILAAAEVVWANRLLKRIKTGTGRLRDAILLRREKKNSNRSPKV